MLPLQSFDGDERALQLLPCTLQFLPGALQFLPCASQFLPFVFQRLQRIVAKHLKAVAGSLGGAPFDIISRLRLVQKAGDVRLQSGEPRLDLPALTKQGEAFTDIGGRRVLSEAA
jgi:hypothetical protein